MITIHGVARCANSECMALFVPPKKYEPLMSFCPGCRQLIHQTVLGEWILEDECFDEDLTDASH